MDSKLKRMITRMLDDAEKLETGLYEYQFDPKTGTRRLWKKRKPKRPLCGAKCRDGHPCQAPAVSANGRCRLHGGLSTGPKTAEGLARIQASNRWRAMARRITKGVSEMIEAMLRQSEETPAP